MRGKAAWCLVAAVVSLSGLRAQDRGGRSYREIVDEFRAHPDDAIGRMLELPDEAVARGVEEMVRPDSVWLLSTGAAALLMHTDAALYLLQRDQASGWVHVDRALALSAAVARDPESAWFVHQWFFALSLAIKDAARRDALVARWHAQPWYPATDAMGRALLLEITGVQRDSPVPGVFNAARPLYNQAIAAHLQIAAVHLGRIEMLRGNDVDARRLLATAATNSHWPTTTYLANLFLGSMDERDGDRESAERRYRLAVDAVPRAQSGRLALAAFLGRSGRTADARRAMAGPPIDDRSMSAFDPWWSYLFPYFDRQGGYKMILTELHVAVQR